MNSRVSVRLCALGVALLVGACKEDPTASLAGTPKLLLINPAIVFLGEGDSINVTVKLLSEGGVPLQGTVQATSSAPTTATVAAATDALSDPTHTTSTFKVKALVRGPAYIRATGLGLKDSARVNVLPAPFVFDGALSSVTPAGGDTLTIDGTGAFGFDPDSVAVTFGGGIEGPIVGATATQIKVLVPYSDADSLTLAGASLPYVAGKTFTIRTPDIVTQTGDVYGIADSGFSTAPTIAIPATIGASTVFLTDVGADNQPNCAEVPPPANSMGPCMIYKFAIASADPVNLAFTTNWDGDADIDIYACPAPVASPTDLGNCFEEGGGGATGDQPQTFTFAFPTGTHYFVIEQFDSASGSPRNIITTVTREQNAPTLTTTPSAGGVVGVVLNDDAALAGGFSPTGSITFKLYDPDQATCTGTPRYEQTVTVAGNGTYSTSPGFTADKAGTWRWTADYSGDTDNTTATSKCSAEPVTVTP